MTYAKRQIKLSQRISNHGLRSARVYALGEMRESLMRTRIVTASKRSERRIIDM